MQKKGRERNEERSKRDETEEDNHGQMTGSVRVIDLRSRKIKTFLSQVVSIATKCWTCWRVKRKKGSLDMDKNQSVFLPRKKEKKVGKRKERESNGQRESGRKVEKGKREPMNDGFRECESCAPFIYRPPLSSLT